MSTTNAVDPNEPVVESEEARPVAMSIGVTDKQVVLQLSHATAFIGMDPDGARALGRKLIKHANAMTRGKI